VIKVKICGIRTLADALAAVEAGADMLGFNFYAKSARFVDLQHCQRICSTLRQDAPSVRLVGVFVNAALDDIQRTMQLCSLDLAQLSGDEPPELCAALAGSGFKAFHGVPNQGLEAYARRNAPAFLVDAAVKGAYGGTGAVADWDSAASVARDHQLLLAGGLGPDNVARAVEKVKPWGVDVASGVEARPGEKDAGKVKAFIQAARSMELK
jgi:phosphoribosylanthranilate isomerase